MSALGGKRTSDRSLQSRQIFSFNQQLSENSRAFEVLAEAEAIAKVVESDPLSLKNEYVTCTERAIKDAGLSR